MIVHQLQVAGNVNVGGITDLAGSVTVGGNLLVSQGISALDGYSILDPLDSTQKTLSLDWRGASDGACLSTSSLTIECSSTRFTGGIEAQALTIRNPTSPSTVIITDLTPNMTAQLKRAAFYNHGVATLYITLLCTTGECTLLLNDKQDPFSADPLMDVTVVASASSFIPVCAMPVPSSKALRVKVSGNDANEEVTVNLCVNYNS